MSGSASGAVRWLLRLEGLSVLMAAMTLYGHLGLDWTTFAWCFLAPDMAFIGYLAGARNGAIAYNITHSYPGAIACGIMGVGLAATAMTTLSLIWMAHIGFDRALGYGLKYADGFRHTHLGMIGKG